jgi:hypothetical protein
MKKASAIAIDVHIEVKKTLLRKFGEEVGLPRA